MYWCTYIHASCLEQIGIELLSEFLSCYKRYEFILIDCNNGGLGILLLQNLPNLRRLACTKYYQANIVVFLNETPLLDVFFRQLMQASDQILHLKLEIFACILIQPMARDVHNFASGYHLITEGLLDSPLRLYRQALPRFLQVPRQLPILPIVVQGCHTLRIYLMNDFLNGPCLNQGLREHIHQ